MKIEYAIIILILIFFVIAAVEFPGFLMYKYYDPHLKKIYPNKSLSGYAAMFNQGALQGGSEYFGVVDESKTESNLIILGPLSFIDSPLALQRVVVSSDGSVIASESLFRPDGQEDRIPYWLAYDFTNSISYGGALYPIDEDPNLIEVRGKVIQELVRSRGGIGRELSDLISDLSIYKKENKLSLKEWKRWQRKVDKAKEKCQPWTPDNVIKLNN